MLHIYLMRQRQTCFASAGHDETGVDIVRKALSWPTRQIALNAGDGSIVVGKILDKVQYNFGYGAQSGEYGKLVTKIVPACLLPAGAREGYAAT